MGIPLYFKTISEKYSDIIQSHIDHNQATRLFLDLNGAIHPVCRNYLKQIEEYTPVERSQIERVMINKLLDYIQKLINFSQADTVFIAIDGVAPLAKMNQQKMRRFKSAWERGTSGDNKSYWDTNMISPGTEFMSFLQGEIRKAIDSNKIHP
jgi:5'-3' exoribonuclease 1